jgi:hypothetical protein
MIVFVDGSPDDPENDLTTGRRVRGVRLFPRSFHDRGNKAEFCKLFRKEQPCLAIRREASELMVRKFLNNDALQNCKPPAYAASDALRLIILPAGH